MFRLWIQGDMVDRKIEDIDRRLTFGSNEDKDRKGQTHKIILNEKSNIEYTHIKNTQYTESLLSKHVLEPSKILSQTEDEFKIKYQRRAQKMMLPWKMHLASPMMRGG